MVGDRPVEATTTGRRRVVAHAPQRLVAFERHRLDVEPCPFGVEAGEIAQDVVGGGSGSAGRDRCVLVDRSGGIVDREVAERPGLRLGVLEDRASAGLDQQQLTRTEPTAPDGLGGGERHGTRLGRDGHEPVRVTAKAAGRSPFRSTSAPTRWPSAKTIAAGPSHGARKPAVRRRSVATCGCGARRSPSASGIAVSRAGVRSQPVEVRSSSASSSDSESEPSSDRSGPAASSARATSEPAASRPAANLLAVAADRVDLAVVGDRAERLGQPPDRMRVRRIALVEDRVADRQRRAQVGVEVGKAAPDDQPLVDDRPRRRRRDGRARRARRRPPARRSRVVDARRRGGARRRRRRSAAGRPHHATAEPRSHARTRAAMPRQRPRAR